ncbi:hypothetical protein [Gluconobacter cerinus]|uniref:hypothetical protein n=1 Tax=Gluconobacter cerinus TaxID=38307 RepID=UPI001B8BA943|nr:hypothetical protein [Gluconobacter cerinus]MBS1037212.1 hypothetical protein [Gluconobacter cerinus]
MSRVNLTGGSYVARSLSVAAQRCLNLYPEPLPTAEGEPVQFAHFLTPGLKVQATGSGVSRCAYQTTQGDALFVLGPNVYLMNATGGLSVIGTISDGYGQVRMCDNGTTLFIVDGAPSGGWYCSLPSKSGETGYGTLIQISDDAFYGSPTIAILDTFFLFVNPDTTNWYTSAAQFADEATTPFDSLYVASDTTSLTTLSAIEVVGQTIWIFGRSQIEFWYDAGASDFPFARIPGVTLEVGCLSPYSIAKVPTSAAAPNGGIMWLGIDKGGMSRVYFGEGNVGKPVSTFAVDGALQAMGDLSGAIGNVYQQAGHIFYVLTIPGALSSWVYDVSCDLWHERCSLAGDTESQIRPLNWTAAYGRIWGADHTNGNIYEIAIEALDDAGSPIKRQRAFPHLVPNGNRAIHRRLMLDMQNGRFGSVHVDWSDDRGATFNIGCDLTIGSSGNSWPTLWRLGMARDRIYRLTWAANIRTALMGAFIDVEPVAS